MQRENKEQICNLQVTDGLTVAVIPDSNHEFLIPTKDVALGYDVSESVFRKHKKNNSEDLIEGKHFIARVTKSNAGCKSNTYNKPPVKKVYWTKRGIVRMGFFIKSGRSKLFRDWAEDLIMNKIDDESKYMLLADRRWISYHNFINSNKLTYNHHSFISRIGHHPSEFLYINSTWYISAEYADYLRKSMDVTGYKETFRNKKFMLNKKNGR